MPKKIIALGMDYRISYMYACNDCSSRFSIPEFNALCLVCGNKSNMDELKWSKSHSVISLNPSENNVTIDNFENVLEKEFGSRLNNLTSDITAKLS